MGHATGISPSSQGRPDYGESHSDPAVKSSEQPSTGSARVRGASLSREAVELGFWAVVAQMLGLISKDPATARSRSRRVEVVVSRRAREQIEKRYDGRTDQILEKALEARDRVIGADKVLNLSLGRYEKERRRLASSNSRPHRPGSAAWPPGAQTIAARLGAGSWATAMRNLGVEAEGQGRPRGSGKLQEEDFFRALSDFLAVEEVAGKRATYACYSEWARTCGSDRRVPSGSTVRQRFGTWSAALAALAEWQSQSPS